MKNVKSKPFIIGLTGGIATGKTTALKLFKEAGFIVIDSDQIVKDLYINNLEMVKEIEDTFKLNSKEPNFKNSLSKLVFNNEVKLKALNNIVHPYVYKELEVQKEKYNKEKYLILDIPLLIEVNYKVDHILLIYTKKATQIKRLMKRDNLNYDDALLRVESQMDIELKKKYADTIINNEIDLKHELNDFIGRLKNAQ